jgi:hypothetical protein
MEGAALLLHFQVPDEDRWQPVELIARLPQHRFRSNAGETLSTEGCICVGIRVLRCVRAEGDETRIGRSREAEREMRLDREAQRPLLDDRVEGTLDFAHELFVGRCRSRRHDRGER